MAVKRNGGGLIGVRGYTLTKRFEGASGVDVFAGTRDGDGLPVIAKRYPTGDHPAAVEQFEREYQLIQGIESDGIVRALALERVEDAHVLILEAFDGVSLREYADQQAPELGVYLTIAIQLSRTLADIHRAGVIHRDLKPTNVLIDPWRLRVRITGFDISVQASTQSTSVNIGVLHGTLPYLSPEQTGRMRRRIDTRSDLYALGITLYELAVGHPPFQGREPLEVIHAHLAREPEPPHYLAPDLPVMISRIILRLLEKAPEDRYQSADALLADLQRCQEALEERGTIPEFDIGVRGGGHPLHSPQGLYGRDLELGALVQAMEAVRYGRTGLVTLSGGPGVGKTALFEEWARRSLGENVRVLRARFEDRSAPFSGFKQALSRFVDEILTESDEELGRWRARLGVALGSDSAAMVEVVPKLGWVLGPQPPLPAVSPNRARARTATATTRFLSAVATLGQPVVLFLDDLHLADEASLGLFEAVASSDEEPPLLLVGVYQSQDPAQRRPVFSRCLERISKAVPSARHLRLQPLRPAEVNRLVAETLGRPERETMALTALIARRTDNNPLFVRQFLSYARELGLFRHDPEEGWSWDLRAIEAAGLPDDVAGMMTDKIARLPLRVQRVLKHAAVIGVRFDLPTLMALDPEPDELAEHVGRLADEGLVSVTGEGYRFSHDRIRRAVLDLVPRVEAARLSRLVGRHRLRDVDIELLGERVFDVVDPLNAGASMIREDEERLQLVQLNLLAGRRALASAVCATAQAYLDRALDLLHEGDLVRHLSLCVEVYMTAARLAEGAGELARAEELYQTLLTQELDEALYGRVVVRLVELYGLQGDPERAVSVGLMGLRRLGIRLPRRPSRLRLLFATLWTWLVVALRPERTWDALEPGRAPDQEARRRILGAMGPAAFRVNRGLSALPVLWELRSLRTQGYFVSPALLVGLFGVLLGQAFRLHRSAAFYGRLALRLTKRYPDAPGNQRAQLVIHAGLLPWSRPWKDSIGPLAALQEASREGGKGWTASWAAYQQALLHLFGGGLLEDVEETALRGTALAQGASVRDLAALADLVGGVAGSLRRGEAGEDLAAEPRLEALGALPGRLGLFDGATIVGLGLLVLGRHHEARAVTTRVDPEAFEGAYTGVMGAEHRVVRALAGAAVAPLGDPAARGELRRVLRVLRSWERAGEGTFRPRRHLLEAEMERLEGNSRAAMEAYTDARVAAGKEGVRHLQALATERQGLLALAEGWDLEAQSYLTHARRLYEGWGARAKVRQLDEAHGRLLHPLTQAEAPVSLQVAGVGAGPTVQGDASFLDLSTVVATARALSEEVDLDRLLERILTCALENAGAGRGALLLADGSDLVLEAELKVGGDLLRHRPALRI